MRVIEMERPGGAEVLRLSARDVPEPKAGELLLRVRAAGVNRPDLLQRAGLYRAPADASDLLGLEAAGEVAAVGAGVAGWAIGDAVCALLPGGGYAEYALVPAAHVLPVPQGLTMIEAAGLCETLFTVWSNLFMRAKLQAGERLLVHGGSSGIGTTAIQLAAARGVEVYATAGSAEKCAACVALGAHRAINYREADFLEVIREATAGRGVDVILDMVGASYAARNLSALAEDGRLVLIAVLEGAKAELNLAQIMMRRLSVTGSTLRPQSVAQKAQIAAELREEVWPLLGRGQIRPVIDRVFPLEAAAQAHLYMESSAHIGKIILEL